MFRKRKPFGDCDFSPAVIKDVVTEEVRVGTSVVNVERVVDCSLDEYMQRHPICMEDYSLEEQLRAGVPLKEIPCSTMLDSTDVEDYEVNQYAESELLSQLNSISEKEDSINV